MQPDRASRGTVIVENDAQRRALLARSRTIAMVGASNNPQRPSFGVFAYLRAQPRFVVVPVNPMLDEVDGVAAAPTLAAFVALHGAPDIVDVFRKASDVVPVTRDAIAVGAKAIWFQLGVVNEEAIRLADEAGLDVVVDRCIKIDHAAMAANPQ